MSLRDRRYPQQQQAQGQPNFSQFTPQQIAQMQQMQQIQAAQAAQQAAQQQQQQRPAYSSNASQQAVPQQQMPLASKKTAQMYVNRPFAPPYWANDSTDQLVMETQHIVMPENATSHQIAIYLPSPLKAA